ncbi:Zn-dependent protease, partial [Brucella abortus]
MAREDQSGDWAGRFSPSLDEIESIAIDALAHLPQEFRAL